MKELGKHLAELRKKNHYKQKDLAKELNVSQQVISNIERGFHRYSKENGRSIWHFTGLSC